MCCCSHELPHNESQKFQIVNPTQKVNERVFEELEKGDVEILEPDMSQIKIPFDNRRKYWFRKEEVHLILDFLKEPDQKLLVINGPRGQGKLRTLIKAIWFAAEHEMNCLSDGAFLIDLEEVQN